MAKRLLLVMIALSAVGLVSAGQATTGREIGDRQLTAHADSVRRLPCSQVEPDALAATDCCAGHMGVCGCRAGRIVCCDGTDSEVCTCRSDTEPGASL